MAKALNCESAQKANPCGVCITCTHIDKGSCPDVIELDAASNGGVDTIRSITDFVQYRSIMASRRVIILDEAHAMSKPAFQASLKLLEEPPPNTVFMMATTEVSAIPETILSRGFSFEFKRITTDILFRYLSRIAAEKNMNITQDAVKAVAGYAKGGARDAITLLEQLSSLDEQITSAMVLNVTGSLSFREISELVHSLFAGDVAKALMFTRTQASHGVEAITLLGDMLSYLNSAISIAVSGFELDMTKDEAQEFQSYYRTRSTSLDQMLELQLKVLQLLALIPKVPVAPYSLLDANWIQFSRKSS